MAIIKRLILNIIRSTGYNITKWPSPELPGMYDQDSLRTAHNHDFMTESDFVAAYQRGIRANNNEDPKMHWRVHVALWVASHVKKLGGDFVECGVNRGLLSSSIMNYLDWNSLDKHFYLFDTFCGIDESYLNEEEKKQGRIGFSKTMYRECYEEVKASFAEFRRVHLIRGSVPDTLSTVNIEKVCYLSIDMNCAEPEIEAATFFLSTPN